MLSFVSEEINQYCEKHSTLPSPVATRLEEKTIRDVDYPQMLSGSLVGSFLGFLTSMKKPKRVLEVGTYTGYSALCIAERLTDDAEIITLDINPETVAIAENYWKEAGQNKKIKALVGPALNTINTLKPGFDFVFIDADKTNYLNYLKAIIPLLNKGALIVLDNCLWSGRVLDGKTTDPDTRAIQEVNTWIANEPSLEKNLLPLRDGLFLVRVKD